jgi:hypothetical protein
MHTPCARFLKTSAWYRVPGPGYLAPGTRDRINAEGQTPSTEDRPKPAHRVCMMQDRIRIRISGVRYLGPDTRDRPDAEDRETRLPGLLGIETAAFRICAAKP